MARVACGHKSMLCYILYLMGLLGGAFQVITITAKLKPCNLVYCWLYDLENVEWWVWLSA